MSTVVVKNGNVEFALRNLKQKNAKDGLLKEPNNVPALKIISKIILTIGTNINTNKIDITIALIYLTHLFLLIKLDINYYFQFV